MESRSREGVLLSLPFATVIPSVRLDTHLCCSHRPALGHPAWAGGKLQFCLELRETRLVPARTGSKAAVLSRVLCGAQIQPSSGVRAIPPSRPQRSLCCPGAHLTGDALVLGLCQGHLSVFFCGGVCEARQRKQVLIKKGALKLGPVAALQGWHSAAFLPPSDSASSDISTLWVVSVVQGWSSGSSDNSSPLSAKVTSPSQ